MVIIYQIETLKLGFAASVSGWELWPHVPSVESGLSQHLLLLATGYWATHLRTSPSTFSDYNL